MNSIAFRMLAEELEQDEQYNDHGERVARRKLRDVSNPLELPQTLFEKYYRVNKPAFQYLLDLVIEHTDPPKKTFAVSPIIKLSAVLRFFAEGGYQTGIGKDCDVSLAQCSLSKVLSEIVDLLETHLCPKLIKFCKTSEEKQNISLGFYTKHGIPSVIGCVDGTHVSIIAPTHNKHLYYNRKGYYSINVMLVCDHELNILYVDASHPGHCHDSFVWNASELRTHLEQEYLQGVDSYWLLGDAGYPLEPWLMTPYRSPAEGSDDMKFNLAHSKCRNIIERTNGVLKNRWRCLLGARQLHYTPKKAAKFINVCCALHNLCIKFKCSNVFSEVEVAEDPELQDLSARSLTQARYLAAAHNIRNNIRNNLQ